jgi:large subunit ribosomal protein L18
MALKKQELRARRKRRIRSQISGTAVRPRLSVFRSNRGFSAQLIDDEAGRTIASASIKEGNVAGAQSVASLLGEKYTGPCVFDRNGYAYQGRVQAFADAAREAGMQF